MDGWIVFNFMCAVVALVSNLARFRKENPRRWMRFAAALIALYVGGIYLLSIFGIIPESEIRFFLRWFQAGIMIYITVEAWNG